MSMKRPAGIAGAVCACVALAGCAGAPVDDRPVVRIEQAAQAAGGGSAGTVPADRGRAVRRVGHRPQRIHGATGRRRHRHVAAQCGSRRGGAAGLRQHRLPAPEDRLRRQPGAVGGQRLLDRRRLRRPAGLRILRGRADGEHRRRPGVLRGDRRQVAALQRPDRGTAARHTGVPTRSSRISEVTFDQRVVSASVLHASVATGSPPGMRARAWSGDCIVDVELADPRGVGGAQPAVGVAELILDKIAAQR